MEGKEYLTAIAAYPNTNTKFWEKIIGYFPNLESAWESNTTDLREAGLEPDLIKDFCDYRTSTDPAKEQEKLDKYNVQIIPITDSEYPESLKEIYNPPFVLYVKGKLLPEDEKAIAVVGSRKGTDYGRRATRDITEGISKAGMTIVSGLALGLDAVAHQAALDSGGRTIAVLANGLHAIYPVTNRSIGEKILKNGALISEKPIGTQPMRQYFPARNRIISGLSQGVFITEAGENSGTWHTATFALEQGRDVYALPGSIYNPLSKVPNLLIKMGAKPVSCAQDILEDFGIE